MMDETHNATLLIPVRLANCSRICTDVGELNKVFRLEDGWIQRLQTGNEKSRETKALDRLQARG